MNEKRAIIPGTIKGRILFGPFILIDGFQYYINRRSELF